jgi:hypothetical protein
MQTTPKEQEMAERCSGCGLIVRDGTAGCQAIMDHLLARDFSDAAYFRVHRMMVDTYCLQHPNRYCVSAKSLAAHLTGLCWLVEHGGDRRVGSELLRRWLNASPRIEKPEIPSFRGSLTIADVCEAPNPEAYAGALELWARSTWEAYSALHSLARQWIEQALSRQRSPMR